MNVACPNCETVFRIDPERVPEAGVRARCSRCDGTFRLTREGAQAEVPAGAAGGAGGGASGGASAAPAGVAAGFPFAPADPETRARRIARALVSDIVAYHGERLARSRESGTLRGDFRSEIMKSWEEYVDQVGEPLARRTPFFRDALNDVLAAGRKVF